jgi:hypothetical protein
VKIVKVYAAILALLAGVSGFAAASAWSEGADKMGYIKMHQAWIQVLADFIKTR